MNFKEMPKDPALAADVYSFIAAHKNYVLAFMNGLYAGSIDIEFTSVRGCATLTREQVKDVYSLLRVKGLV